jgi:hypothetical protein
MLAADISDQVFPSIDRLKNAVAKQRRFAVSNSGINEDGGVIGCVGLRCEEEHSMRKPALAFAIVVTRISAEAPKTAHGSVMWSIPWVRGKQDGFVAYEAKTRPVRFDGRRLPAELVSALPHLEDAFIRALGRGQPPGTLRSLWRKMIHGIPMPQIIRLPEEPNKAPATVFTEQRTSSDF